MQIIKRTLAMLMVFAMVVACLPTVGLTALAEENTATTHQTLLWDAGSGAAAFESPYIATTSGRNTPSISRVHFKGVNQKSALAYTQETLSGTGAAMTNMVGFNSKDSLTANGFNTTATVQADDDIIWFWMDSDMTNDMRLQVTINSGQVGGGTADADSDGDGTNDYCSTVYVYTIEENAETGEPEMVKVYRQAHDAAITGLGLVDTRTDMNGSYSQLKLAGGWSGWVGIPCNMITNGNTVKTGASLTSLTLFMRMYETYDGTLKSQQAGESMYFDEFWLTSAGQMPALTNAELLYKEPVQTVVWNQESNTKEVQQESIYSEANEAKNGPRNNSLFTQLYGYGVGGSTALKYEATEAGDISSTVKDAEGNPVNRSITNTNTITWKTYGCSNPTANSGDIFWLWVDAAWSTTQRFTFQLQGKDVAKQSEGDTYIYTIVNKDGLPAIEKVLYSPDHTAPVDSIDGLDLVNATPQNNTSKSTQIRLSKDWSGWIGIPVDLLTDSSTAIIGQELTKFSLLLNQYSCEDAIENQQVGDAVYMDEFWLTSAGSMPDLSVEELLYVGGASANEPRITHQTAVWDQESNTQEVYEECTYTDTDEQSRNNSLTTDVAGFGVLGSNALKFEATEAGAITGTNSEVTNSITHTLSKLTWGNYGATNPTVQAKDDIFWFWVDASLSTSQRLLFQLEERDIKLRDDEDTCIYTIVADAEGKPVMQAVPYSADPDAPVDTVDGLDLVNSTPYNNTSTWAQIRLAKDWSGWIGLPLNYLSSSSLGTLDPGTTLEKFTLLLRQYSTDDPIEDQQVGDAVYLDEFWLTSSGMMPDLSDEALLYTCNGNVCFADRYADGMIFQQNKAWMVHGTAEAGQTVTVKLIDANGEAVQTKTCVAADGTWSVTMDAVAGSYDTYSIEASCIETVYTLENIVFGEVWVAGGQSNMDYTITQTAGNVNDDYAPAIAEAFGSIQDVEDLKVRLAAEGSNAEFIRVYLQDSVAGDIAGEHTEAAGRWTNGSVWADVEKSSALAFYYAEKLQNELNVPVGIIETPKGGTSITTWLDEDVLTQQNEDGSYKYQEMYDLAQRAASFTSTAVAHHVGAYFNTRIAPFQGYEVKGILWYQGENDRNQPVMQQYGPEVLVESWSKVFTMDPENVSDTALDFVVFQIAPFAGYDSNGVYPDADLMDNTALNAAMREGFGKVQANGGNVVMIPIYDLSAVLDNHHPLNKLDVAARAIQVVMETYYNADAANVYSGPSVSAVEYQDSKIVLTFDQAIQYIRLTETDNQRITPEGNYVLPSAEEMWGDKLNGFSIYTGIDYVSVEDAVIVDNTVELTIPEGVNQVAGVAYAYGVEVLSANLYDMDGMPALPFLTVKEGYVAQLQTSVWDLEDQADGTAVGTVEDGTNTHNVSAAVMGSVGVQGSKAFAYTLTEVIANKTASDMVTINLADYGYDTTVQIQDEQILWFWADSDLSADARLHLALNTLRMRGVAGDVIYTITANEDGKPSIVEIPWQFSDMESDIDGIDGLSFVHYLTSNGADNSFARVKFSNGWSGWVGVPLSCFKEAGTALKDGDTITSLAMQLYKNNDASYDEGTLANGDTLILDEFWVTSAGLMPDLSDEALLYTESEETISVEEWNLVLGDEIGVNFYASIPESCIANTTATITVNGVTSAVEGVADGDYYVFTVGVAAAQMMDSIEFKLVYANQVVTKTCTIREYADEILNGDYTEATKTLVKQMLNYGAAAQTYFGHNADNLANNGITVETVELSGVTAPAMGVSGSVEGIRYYGATLVFKSCTAVRIYFSGSVDGCTFQVGESKLTPVAKDGLYYVEIADIAPQDLGASIEVKVTGGDQVMTVTYSPMNYMVRMAVKGSDSLKALLKAMYNYHLAAVECVK